MPSITFLKHLAVMLCLALCLSACTEQPERATTNETADQIKPEESATAHNDTANIAHTQLYQLITNNFTYLKQTGLQLKRSLEALPKAITPDDLKHLQTLWLDCHNAYLSTRLFRAWAQLQDISHPVLDNKQSQTEVQHTLQQRIDQHPLIPGYLDKVPHYPYSGLIHSDIAITAENLNDEHLLGDEAYVTIGFHALEFILFGAKEPRSNNDFDRTNKDEKKTSTAKRRVDYIKLLGELLHRDITTLAKEWSHKEGFYTSALLGHSNLNFNALGQATEIELEAITHIRQAIAASNDNSIHDTHESLDLREALAQQVLSLLNPKAAEAKTP